MSFPLTSPIIHPSPPSSSSLSTTTPITTPRTPKSKLSKKNSTHSVNSRLTHGGVTKQKSLKSNPSSLSTFSISNYPLEYGCPHMNVPKSSPIWANLVLFRNYTNVIHQGRGWNDTTNPLPPYPSCKECSDTRRVLFCLHCRWSSCWKQRHIHDHLKESESCTFAFDFDHRHVFCNRCNDYVYDERFLKPRFKPPSNKELDLIRQFSQRPSKCGGILGLRNMGATCYLNVVLQTFIHNPYFRTFFLSDRHSSSQCKASKPCIACELDALFAQVFSGDTLPHVPHSFLWALWNSQSDMAASGQHDAHECFISLANALHSVLVESETLSECSCLVHSTFGGMLRSQLLCPCGNIQIVDDPFLDISLDVPNLLDAISLLTCLNKFTSPESISYSCSLCLNTTQALKNLRIQRLPSVLGFQLKRFESTSSNQNKIETPVLAPSTLDMAPYLAQNELTSRTRHVYHIFALIHHKGQLHTGHYTAYILHKNHWFRLDDEKISIVSEAEATVICVFTQVLSQHETQFLQVLYT